MTESLEALAAEGAAVPVDEAVSQRLHEAAQRVAKLVRCPYCQGHGVDNSKWAFLWGGACWVCSGWGSVRTEHIGKIRGLGKPHPSR